MSTPDKNVVVISHEEADQGDQDDNRKRTSRKSVSSRRSTAPSRHRRSTYGFGNISGVSSISGRSNYSYKSIKSMGLECRRPHRKYLNTYQLEPRKPFDAVKVTNIVENILEDLFLSHEYHPNLSPSLALMIAGEIRYRVLYQKYDRYRIIPIVTIGQRKSQCYNNAVSFLWDHERDGFTNCTMEVSTAFIQATVFAIYLD